MGCSRLFGLKVAGMDIPQPTTPSTSEAWKKSWNWKNWRLWSECTSIHLFLFFFILQKKSAIQTNQKTHSNPLDFLSKPKKGRKKINWDISTPQSATLKSNKLKNPFKASQFPFQAEKRKGGFNRNIFNLWIKHIKESFSNLSDSDSRYRIPV